MKQICPFCGAELAENARFCLYCMSPLTEKTVLTDRQPNRRRRWLLAIVPVALGLLVAGGVWLWKGGDPMAANVTPEKTASDASGAGRSDAAVTASVTASGQVGGQTTGREDPVGTSLPGRQSGTTGSLVSTKTSGRTGAASSAGTTRAAGSTFARGSSG
ncbi:MAG: zinc-ribbon domain-containing protein, partial [Acutalibacteraceae bacterium]